MKEHDQLAHSNLAGTMVKLYRTHWRLFWCIMLPVAIVAIPLDIAQFMYLVPKTHISDTPSRRAYTFTSSINTNSGIALAVADTNASPDVRWRLFPIPSFSRTDSEGVTWKWELKFRGLYYGPLILLLFTFCPLSLAVARVSGGSQVSDLAKPTAREMWRQTGRKAFTLFVATLLFLFIVDIGSYIYLLMSWLLPSLHEAFPMELSSVLTMVPYIYLLVTLSLYNPCLILENNTIIGIFRRSHALVSRARLRFFGTYLLTGWIAAVIISVLLGTALLGLSISVPELAQVREALSPLKFLSLFIGGDIAVVLPQTLSTPGTVAILIVRGLIATFLVPMWAILTTLLYLKWAAAKNV